METEIEDANHFTMIGGGLEVTVSPGRTGGIQVGYHGAEPVRTFEGAEIVGESGSVGPSVSVVLTGRDGDDRTTLTLLVPRVRVRRGERTALHTFGIHTVHPAAVREQPDLVGQLGRSTVLEMSGTASFVDGG